MPVHIGDRLARISLDRYRKSNPKRTRKILARSTYLFLFTLENTNQILNSLLLLLEIDKNREIHFVSWFCSRHDDNADLHPLLFGLK